MKNPYIDRKPTFYKTEGRKCILPPRQGGRVRVLRLELNRKH